MVVVIRAVPVTNIGLCSFIAFTTSTVGTSLPISIASYPPALKNMTTRFLPISCGSPSATKETTVPLVSLL